PTRGQVHSIIGECILRPGAHDLTGMLVSSAPQLDVRTVEPRGDTALLGGDEHDIAALPRNGFDVRIVVAPELMDLVSVLRIEGWILRIALTVREEHGGDAICLSRLFCEILENARLRDPCCERTTTGIRIRFVDLREARAASAHDRMRG